MAVIKRNPSRKSLRIPGFLIFLETSLSSTIARTRFLTTVLRTTQISTVTVAYIAEKQQLYKSGSQRSHFPILKIFDKSILTLFKRISYSFPRFPLLLASFVQLFPNISQKFVKEMVFKFSKLFASKSYNL